jgi:hypothetical protein
MALAPYTYFILLSCASLNACTECAPVILCWVATWHPHLQDIKNILKPPLFSTIFTVDMVMSCIVPNNAHDHKIMHRLLHAGA